MKRACRRGALTGLILACLVTAAAPAPADDEAYWPQWRGPSRDGVARGAAPLRWSDTENIRWKAEIPGRGFSTPVIWGDRIFLTTAVPTRPMPAAQPEPEAAEGRRGRPGGDPGPQPEHRFEVLALDRKSGKLLWQRTARVAAPHEGYHRLYGSYASNAPATDGRHLYAFFGSRGVYCYDLDGNLIWEKDFGVQMQIRLQFGEGTAAVLHDNALILNYDHEGASFITALNKETGETLWRTDRAEMTSWTAPLVVEHAGRKQIVVSATTKVRSYDFETGKLIWECAGIGLNPIPAPVSANGLVYVMSGYRNPNLMAIRLGREGDLTGTDAVAWSGTRGLSYTASPVLQDGRLYVVTDNGTVSCFDAATGQPYYQQERLPDTTLKASPVAAGGHLYVATEGGKVFALTMGDRFEIVNVNTLQDQVFIASPVVAAGQLFLRSQSHLFCIGE